MARIETTKLILNGYMYVQSRRHKERLYWDCRLVRSKECKARAITNIHTVGGAVVVYKDPDESKHAHPPNREKCKAEVAVAGIKRKAVEHPELRSAQVL